MDFTSQPQDLQKQLAAQMSQSQAVPERWKFCPRDGRKFEIDWKHCPQCGASIGNFFPTLNFGGGIAGYGSAGIGKLQQ